jgi:hypothetical protein
MNCDRLCLKSSITEDVNCIIAAERRDVYSYGTASYYLRKERNAKHVALCGRSEKALDFYKYYVPTARLCADSLER